MENKEEKSKLAEIDKDILDLFQEEKAQKIINDPKLFNRAMLNAFAELLSEFKKLNTYQDNLFSLISILSSEKLQDYFVKVKDNYEEAVKEEKTKNKVININSAKKNKK